MIQSIERHDIVNAAALAAALLLCGVLLLRWIGYLGATVSDGLWQAEKAESVEDTLSDIDPASVFVNGSRPPNEVGVRVANGSDGRNGLAGRGTERLSAFGYGTLTPENREGDPGDESYVYYTQGFLLDARQVAAVLEVPETNVILLGSQDIGVTIDGADVIVVLGNNAPI